jgi:c-di-GMP-binding flagellar brake protein YcgR
VSELEQGQTVLVRLSSAAALAARVDSIDGAEAVLILLTPPLRPPAPDQPVAVETTTRRGVVQLQMRVVSSDGRGSLRVAPVAGERPAGALQRRDFVRVDACVPVVVRDGGPGGPAHDALTVNVSAGGLMLAGLSHLPVGAFAWVTIDLEDGEPPVEALITVVRVAERGLRAVRIASISARDEQRIVRFTFARERRARMTREG